MPKPGLPLTPASSTDIQAKDQHERHLTESAFKLPPAAIASAESSTSSNVSVKSDSSYRPTSPASSRKRSRTNESTKQTHDVQPSYQVDFSLPPPPTRSRRIIQMKPGTEKKAAAASEKTEKKKPTTGHGRTGSSTTAAGRKTARKTAHSIIERRRRSKMNEEFNTLKGMIPACRGQSMHKLAILQAGIDYMRYLERCLVDLKIANQSGVAPSQSQAPTPRPCSPVASEDSPDDNEFDEDHDMESIIQDPLDAESVIQEAPSRGPSGGYASSHASPYILPHPQDIPRSTNTSALPSPAFGPRTDSWSHLDKPRIPYLHSTQDSPTLPIGTMQDATHEATAALLMLNTDRRYSRSERTTQSGGLRVRDLLSS